MVDFGQPDGEYVVQWLVPAKNAVGGRAYWTDLEDGRFEGQALALAALKRAGFTHGAANVRLVFVTKQVIAGPDDE